MSRIVVISDTHIGDPAALWPEEYVTPTGAVIESNPAQKVMLQYWKDFWSRSQVRSAEYILHLSECIEGFNRKGNAQDLMIADLNLQVEAFEQLFRPHIKGRTLGMVTGSLYHGSREVKNDKIICDRLKGVWWGVVGNWKVKGTDKIINLSHKNGNPMIYKSTALDRESLFRDALEGIKFKYHADLIVRAHWHQFFLVQNSSRIVYSNPCWKFWKPIEAYGGKGYHMSQPTIGGTVISIPKQGRLTVELIDYPSVAVYDALKEI